jgi:thiamine biosynthesis lipoprotein
MSAASEHLQALARRDRGEAGRAETSDPSRRNPGTVMRRAQPHLGTLVEIECEGVADPAGAFADAFAQIAGVDALMSFHCPTSDVARINRARPGEAVVIAPATFRVLSAAGELTAESRGAFDCAIGATLVARGVLPHPAGARAVRFQEGCWRDLELRGQDTVVKHRDLFVDLGGIAKGFAVDRAVDALRAHGVCAGAVNAGGDLRVFGAVARSCWIRTSEGLLALGALRDAALATSARPIVGPSASELAPGAIVDPARGRLLDAAAAVSVIAPECMTADALTKVALVASPALARQIFARRGALRLDHAALRAAHGESCTVVRDAHAPLA